MGRISYASLAKAGSKTGCGAGTAMGTAQADAQQSIPKCFAAGALAGLSAQDLTAGMPIAGDKFGDTPASKKARAVNTNVNRFRTGTGICARNIGPAPNSASAAVCYTGSDSV
ncbi:MAG: hypothetical protein ACREET_17090 [Stellaceae bacterium]